MGAKARKSAKPVSSPARHHLLAMLAGRGGRLNVSNLLISDRPIVFLPELARFLGGANDALVLQQIHYWLQNLKAGKEEYGRRWVRNTAKEWQEEHFTWLSVDSVSRILNKLEEMGYLESSNFNDNPNNRAKWYTINYSNLEKGYRQFAETGHRGNLPQTDQEQAKIRNTTYSGERPKKQAKPVQERKTVPIELVTAFCKESGIAILSPASRPEWAEYNRMWRDPLWHVHHSLCADDLEQSVQLVRETVINMRERGLDISSPNSIKKVATAIKARNNRQRVVSVY